MAQGSIAGPILFILFINDLSSFLPHGRLLSYADDTQLLDQSTPDVVSLSHLKSRAEESILNLQTWFRSNSLKMNPDKTNFIIFGSKSSLKKASDFHITLSDSHIRPEPTVKVLGVTLDQCLTWEAHISAVVRKTNAILLSLYKIRHYFSPDILKVLVHAHVFPHLLYCMSVWGGAPQCRLSRIQRCLNFAARLITGVKRSDHITPSLESLGWSRMDDMIRRRDCIHVFRALNEPGCPLALKALFVKRSQATDRATRAAAAGELHLDRCRLSATQRMFSYRAAVAWNKLPRNVTAAPTRQAFIRSIDKH